MAERSLDHHIQRDIIIRLSLAENLRFSDLKPTGLENNHFMYHLKLLIKDGLIRKDGNLYSLAPAGLTYVDQLSYKKRRPRQQPKIIAILVINNGKDQYLLARRRVQPYFGYAMLPSGKQHFAESPFDHAARELKEKTGLSTELKKCGYVNVKISGQGQVISHVAAHVFSGRIKSGLEIKQGDERFELFWQDSGKLSEAKLMPGSAEIVELIKTSPGQIFFESLEYSLP